MDNPLRKGIQVYTNEVGSTRGGSRRGHKRENSLNILKSFTRGKIKKNVFIFDKRHLFKLKVDRNGRNATLRGQWVPTTEDWGSDV
jgi:hypothetical protein